MPQDDQKTVAQAIREAAEQANVTNVAEAVWEAARNSSRRLDYLAQQADDQRAAMLQLRDEKYIG